MATVVGVIFAGGVGARMRHIQTLSPPPPPKQFLEIDNKPIIVHTIERFQNHPSIDEVVIACVSDWIPHLQREIETFELTKVVEVVEGGITAQDSIYNGLLAVQRRHQDDTIVLLHDAVRPIIAERLLSALIESVESVGNGVACTPCHETIVTTRIPGRIEDVTVRSNTFTVQAPQAFRLGEILRVHEQIRRENPHYENMIDACTMWHHLGLPISMVQGNFGNIKVTSPVDVYLLQALLQVRKVEDLTGTPLLDVEDGAR